MLKVKKVAAIFSILLSFFFVNIIRAAPGDVDTSFNAALKTAPNLIPSVRRIVRQPDGKILIAGNFSVIQNKGRSNIARYNPDGTVDETFKPVLLYKTGLLDATVFAIGVQSNGKIYVSGDFQGAGTTTQKSLVRLNADGSLDTSFQPNFVQGAFVNEIYDIVIQPDDKVLIGGAFRISETGIVRQTIARLNADGSIDTSYQDNTGAFNVQDIELLDDGKIVFSTSFTNNIKVVKVNSDGSVDSSFTSLIANSVIRKIKALNNGMLLIGGDFIQVGGFTKRYIARLNSDGTLDDTFIDGGPGSAIYDITEDTGGKYLVVGFFDRYFNVSLRKRIARINTDGTYDTTFNYPYIDEIVLIRTVIVLPDGKIIFGGDDNANKWKSLVQLNSDGSLDSGISYSVEHRGIGYKVFPLPNGQVLVGGIFQGANDKVRQLIVRFNANGTVDDSFTANAIDDVINDIAVLPDGKILMGGRFFRVNGGTGHTLVRLNSDGTVDPTFNTSIQPILASVEKIVVQPNGKILIGGNFAFQGQSCCRSVARLNADGSEDTSFGTQSFGNQGVREIVIQTDGKIIIGGGFTIASPTVYSGIARLTADGNLDTTFAPSSGVSNLDFVLAIELQTDGKIIIGGTFTGFNGDTSKQYVARLNSNGSLDNSFQAAINGPVYDLLIQPNGKILMGGSMFVINGVEKRGFGRINGDGTLDAGFNVGMGANSTVRSLAPTSDGKILIGGEFTRINGESAVGVGRLLDTNIPTATDYDFDGDGSADIVVFRPSNNVWYQLLGPNYQYSQTNFGLSGDIVAPADFDGDGKTDLGIFRPASGDWWYLSSVTNTQINVRFGQNGDIPKPTDFDGDGKADFIVFRPSTSQWFRFGSTGGSSTVSFGLSGDKPLIGDFDGDGKSDVAIYRPSSGDWWWQSSIDNVQRATRWGIPTDIPTPGDYDGDGKTDFAVYRPETGVWYILNSSNLQATIISFGLAEDKPVPADYDGDGKTDIAVFRPSTGVWYQLRSAQGFQALQFGISTDIPIPNALIPN